jgi:predicted transcriptional regulator
VALNDAGVVQGRVTVAAAAPPGASVSDVMDPRPATVRANEDLAGALQRMRKRRVATLLVTTPEGAAASGRPCQPVEEDRDKGNNGVARA